MTKVIGGAEETDVALRGNSIQFSVQRNEITDNKRILTATVNLRK